MGTHIVILGGGTGGTLTANRLRRMYDEDDCRITVVDQDDDHVYQPGLLFVPFGAAQPHHLVRSRPQQLHAAVDYKQARIERVDLDARTVHLSGGIRMTYDVLVVATGATLLPEETEGLTGPGWGEKVFTFYDLPGAVGLHHALERLEGGRVVVNVADLPIKCPVAPLEFAFLADWYFQRRGIRDKVQLTYVTPLDGAFTKPVAAEALGGLLAAKGIELVTEFTLGEVDGEGGRLVSYDEREVPFDLAVVVPLHGGAEYVERSPGLGDELGFIPVDQRTLQHPQHPEVFAIGDAAGLPASKAGSVAHFAGETLTHNIGRFLAGQPLDATFHPARRSSTLHGQAPRGDLDRCGRRIPQPRGQLGGWVSYMRTATSSPEAAVRAATVQMAVVRPYASARTPASRAPTAKPPSRHRRYTPTERARQAGWATSPMTASRVG
jgi:sulfide:quinone oxidoreductase